MIIVIWQNYDQDCNLKKHANCEWNEYRLTIIWEGEWSDDEKSRESMEVQPSLKVPQRLEETLKQQRREGVWGWWKWKCWWGDDERILGPKKEVLRVDVGVVDEVWEWMRHKGILVLQSVWEDEKELSGGCSWSWFRHTDNNRLCWGWGCWWEWDIMHRAKKKRVMFGLVSWRSLQFWFNFLEYLLFLHSHPNFLSNYITLSKATLSLFLFYFIYIFCLLHVNLPF